MGGASGLPHDTVCIVCLGEGPQGTSRTSASRNPA